jgi:hypothetical protein
LSSRQSFSYKAKYHGLVWLYTAKKKKILAWKVSLMVTPKNQENMCFTLSSLKREDFIGDMGSS